MKRLVAAGMVASMVVMVLVSVALIVIAATSTPAEAGGSCRCPLIYAPVTCDHNRTYPNQCEADCHNAKNCVPTGGI